jgi:hypothetical protein
MIIFRRPILGNAAAAVVTATTVDAQANDLSQSENPATDMARATLFDLETPDVLVPPATDCGMWPNLKFSFADAQ